jgi:EAL domain-containing protein (putative c-di-GMP-specific phosphodiesterase class I)
MISNKTTTLQELQNKNDSPELDNHPLANFCGISFSHAFQPIVDVTNKEVISYEILVRGARNESAGTVLEKFKHHDLLMFDQYNREIALASSAQLGVNCKLNLNFTPAAVEYEDGYFLGETLEYAEFFGFQPQQIIIEITESEAIQNYDQLKHSLNKYRRTGLTFAIDDFGSGYAGLSMLAEITPEFVKMDMSLIRSISTTGAKQAILHAVNNICTDLGIDIIAEGVESIEELNFLVDNGISLIQGYLIARPGFESLPKINNF